MTHELGFLFKISLNYRLSSVERTCFWIIDIFMVKMNDL